MTVAAVSQPVGRNAAAKPRLYHEMVIDRLLVDPTLEIKALAKEFGTSYQWMLILVNSDGFQKRFEDRRKEMVDPMVRATLADKMTAVASQSLDVLMSKLEATADAKLAAQVLDITSKALGYGAKPAIAGPTNTQVNFVVQVPPKSRDSLEWAAQYSPPTAGPTKEPSLNLPPVLVEDALVVEEVVVARAPQSAVGGANPLFVQAPQGAAILSPEDAAFFSLFGPAADGSSSQAPGPLESDQL